MNNKKIATLLAVLFVSIILENGALFLIVKLISIVDLDSVIHVWAIELDRTAQSLLCFLVIIVNFSVAIFSVRILARQIFSIGEELSNSSLSDYLDSGPRVYASIDRSYVETFIHYEVSRLVDGFILPVCLVIGRIAVLIPVILWLFFYYTKLVFILFFSSFILAAAMYVMNKRSKVFGELLSYSYDARLVKLQRGIQAYTEAWFFFDIPNVVKGLEETNSDIATSKTELYFLKSVPKNIIELFLFAGLFFSILGGSSIDVFNVALAPVLLKILPIAQQVMSGITQAKGNVNTVREFSAFKNKVNSLKYKGIASIDMRRFDIKSFSVSNESNNDFQGVFNFQASNSYILTGESGSGKTSLLKLIAGVSDFGIFNIWHERNRIFGFFDVRNQSAYVGQNSSFSGNSLFEGLGINDKNMTLTLEYASALGIDTLLQEHRGSDIDALSRFSGGELQRCSILRSLLSGRRYQLWDEPSSALDIKRKVALAKLVTKLSDEHVFIIVSHDEVFLNEINQPNFIKVNVTK